MIHWWANLFFIWGRDRNDSQQQPAETNSPTTKDAMSYPSFSSLRYTSLIDDSNGSLFSTEVGFAEQDPRDDHGHHFRTLRHYNGGIEPLSHHLHGPQTSFS